jgi:uncharacterized protein YjbJ (UPF0337 family)
MREAAIKFLRGKFRRGVRRVASLRLELRQNSRVRQSPWENAMSSFEKTAGKAKEAIAKIFGEGERAGEGSAQERRGAPETPATPQRPVPQTAPVSSPAKEEENTDFDPEKVVYYP